MQCYGTVMINCGSGSYFGKVLALIPVPIPDPDYLAQFFNNNKNCTMLEAALFPKKFASNFLSFDFCITFYVRSGSKSGSGMYCGSGFSKEKKSCGSGSTTLGMSL